MKNTMRYGSVDRSTTAMNRAVNSVLLKIETFLIDRVRYDKTLAVTGRQATPLFALAKKNDLI
jgi:hypothetical protein